MCLVGLVGWLGQCDDGPRRVELSSARVTCLGSLVWVLGAADVRIWCCGWMDKGECVHRRKQNSKVPLIIN